MANEVFARKAAKKLARTMDGIIQKHLPAPVTAYDLATVAARFAVQIVNMARQKIGLRPEEVDKIKRGIMQALHISFFPEEENPYESRSENG